MQWKITTDHYRSLTNNPNYDFTENAQNWTRSLCTSEGDPYPYTPVFIDLIDNTNQRTASNPNRCIDNVSGYTLSELQSIMVQSTNLSELRQTLKANLRHGATAAQIDQLLDNYIGLGF